MTTIPQPMYYTRLRKFSLLNAFYLFFDTEEYLADALFIRHKVTVNFRSEYGIREQPYLAILCSVRKKDEEAFLDALRELPNKMALFGHADYLDECTKTFDRIQELREELKTKTRRDPCEADGADE